MTEVVLKMSEDEAKVLYEQEAPDLKLKFSGYYKYVFTFTAETDRMRLSCSCGGDADNIYRYDVGPEEKAPTDWVVFRQNHNSIKLIDKKTGAAYEYEDWYW